MAIINQQRQLVLVFFIFITPTKLCQQKSAAILLCIIYQPKAGGRKHIFVGAHFCRFRYRQICATKMCLNLLCNCSAFFKAGDFFKKNGTSTFLFWVGVGSMQYGFIFENTKIWVGAIWVHF